MWNESADCLWASIQSAKVPLIDKQRPGHDRVRLPLFFCVQVPIQTGRVKRKEPRGSERAYARPKLFFFPSHRDFGVLNPAPLSLSLSFENASETGE